MNEETRFEKVINYIEKVLEKPQGKIAEEVNKKVFISFTTSDISKLKKNGKCPTDEVRLAFFDLYNINPNYLKGTSNFMINDVGVKLEHFQRIFRDWEKIEDVTINKGKRDVVARGLSVSLDKSFFEFLIDVDELTSNDEENTFSLEEKYRKCKEQYNNQSDVETRYVLIPEKYAYEIATDNPKQKPSLSERISGYEITKQEIFDGLDI